MSNLSKIPKFRGKAFLAPMAGVSDPAFRLLCKEEGAGLVVTELTSVHAIVAKQEILEKEQKKISEFIEFSEKERPVSVQLFGHDPELVAKAAKIVEPYFDLIDFNMGCPAPHITNQMAGAALLQKPELNELLFSKLVSAVDKPITLKMRSGTGANNCYLWKPIAKIAEDCGVSMITLHPRTISQGYSGKADWSLIKELKETVSVPVVGNGDIRSPEDAKRMIKETGCDYVMIGRGAMGNPQIFKQTNDFLKKNSYKETTLNEKINSVFKYLKYTKQYPTIKFAQIRTQAMQFTKGIAGGSELRVKIGKTKNLEEIKMIFEEMK